MRRIRTIGTIAAAALALGLLAPGAGADNFLLRGFTWFGYVEGKELREGCVAGASDRLRLIYNGVYQQQVRVYEIERPFAGAPASYAARVLTRLNLSNFALSEIFLGSKDIESRAVLDDAAWRGLVDALAADGLGAKVPDGLTLPSDGFYWVVSACLDGRWHINGWTYPSERFKALRFPALLFARDMTGVAVNPPRPTDAGERMRARTGNQSKLDTQPAFDIKLDDNGVVGRMPGL